MKQINQIGTIFQQMKNRFSAFSFVFLSCWLLSFTAQAQVFCIGSTLAGNIASYTNAFQPVPSVASGQAYYWTTTLAAGVPYTWSNCPAEGGTSSDTYLRIYNAANTLVASADDICGANPTVTYTPGISGLYYVHLAQYSCATLLTSQIISYKAVLPPTIVSFTPASGCPGTSVVITGTNFTGSTAVTFGGTNAASFVVNSATQITAITGAGTTGTIAVTNGTTATSVGIHTINASPAAPTPVTATPSTICAGSSSDLNGISAGNTISWFTVPTGGVALGTSASGANFSVTPAVSTTYYAAASSAVSGTQTFNYTGGLQTFTVPAGVTSLTVDAFGAQGGNNYVPSIGGLGGRMQSTVAVVPGAVLNIYVGGAGAIGINGGGYNGGGASSNNSNSGSGGGASDIRVSPYALANRLVVAGGGGGAGLNCASNAEGGGVGGGLTGGTGFQCGQQISFVGLGGSQLAGGMMGNNQGQGCGQNGGLGLGGNGACQYGGGGGGGYYGGGGGGYGGGGGGSSFSSGAILANTQGVRNGNGQIILTWNVPGCASATRTAVSVAVNSVAAAPSPVTATPASICVGATSQLNSTAVALSTQTWYTVVSGGVAIGTSLSGIDFPVTPAVTTTYYVETFENIPSGSQTFNYTGGLQTFTVPAGISSITVDAFGAQGGNNYVPSIGGLGGRMQSTVPVVAGQILNIYVGGAGAVGINGGGYNGGGASSNNNNSGSGGGASDVRVSPYALANRLVVAGGGGGAGLNCGTTTEGGGVGGGLTGGTGFQCGVQNGGYEGVGGSQLAGGMMGNNQGQGCGQNGSLGLGGNGACQYGGGGGGGYYGGGGGGYGGGGGGSSFSSGAILTNTQGVRNGNGQVIISWLGSVTCPSTPRVPVTVIVNPISPVPSPVTATPASICPGATSQLNSTAILGNVQSWYTVPTGGVAIGTSLSGIDFPVTPAVTTTYYAENQDAAVPGGTQTFNYTGSLQTFTVPAGVTSLTMDVKGAQGGTAQGIGGNGARMQGALSVTGGQVLTILVGQKPANNGGGGGTFVMAAGNVPQMIAGGGGGGAGSCCGNVNNGQPGVTGTSGTAGINAGGGTGAGGVGGNGGQGFLQGQSSGAGGGLLTSGGNGDGGALGGQSYLLGGAGGAANNSGGYGGGGSSHCAGAAPSGCAGGGGGGYSGGGNSGGGPEWGSGGGGGSYSIATGQVNTSGFQTGNGQVIITWVGAGVPCPSTRVPVTVTVNTVPVVTASASPSSICPGGSSVLTGGGALNYAWNPGALVGSPTVTPAATTTYSLIGTDVNGCTGATTVDVTVYTSPVVTASASPSSICPGGSSVLTGGGALNYAWNPGALVGSPTVTPAATTTYSLIGTDVNGCTGATTVDVTVYTSPVVTASASPSAICLGGSSVLTGGGAASYLWQPGALAGSPTVMPGATTAYTVTGTDGNGCIGTSIATVTVNPISPTPSPVTATPAAICIGGTSQLNSTAVLGNIQSWYTVPTGGVAIGTSLSGIDFPVTPVVTTTYYAENLSGAGGTQTFNYTGAVQTFTVPAGVTSMNIDARGAQGGGSNGGAGGLGAKMTGDFAVTPGQVLNIVVPQLGNLQIGGNVQNSSGGGGGAFVYTTGPNTLLVAAGGGGGKCNYAASPPLHPGAAGSITANGNASSDGAALGGVAGNGGDAGLWSGIACAGGGTGWLTNGGGPYGGLGFATWAGGIGFCAGGGGGCGGVGGFGGGGGGGNHYGGGGGGGGYSGGGGGTDPTHGGGGGSFSSGTGQINTAGFQAGDGQVILTWVAAGSCPSVRVPVTVTVNPLPVLGTAVVAPTPICLGATAVVTYTSACPAVVGFADAYAPANWVLTTTGNSNGTINSGGAPANIVMTSSNGLAGSGSTNWTITAPCTGNVTFDWAYTTVDGPLFDYPRYSVNGGAQTLFNGYSTGGLNTQSGTQTIAVTAGQSLELNIYSLDNGFGSCVATITNFAVSAGPVPTITWFDAAVGGINLGTGLTLSQTPAVAGAYTYYAEAQDALTGCTNPVRAVSNSLTVNALPVVTASASPSTICEGGSSVLTGGAAVTYAWNPGALVGSPTVTPIVTTTYSVVGTDGNGCTGASTVEVTVNPAPIVIATATPSTTCAQTTVTPSASGAATIGWSGGLLNNVAFIATATTTYTVTGTDGLGCNGTTTVLVTVNPMSGVLAPATSNQSQDQGDDFNINYYDASCNLIATVDDGAGGNILGLTTSTVTVLPGFGTHNGQPYVQRWYQITPTNNGAADVILYITQAEFNDYNAGVALPYLPLPTGPLDASGIANVRITKNADAGLGNTPIVITPTVTWNALNSYWELSFSTPGFSQFRVHSVNPGNIPLPATVTNFSGMKLETSDKLSWTTSSEQNNAYFNLQHGTDGTNFTTLARVDSKAPNGNSAVTINYTQTNAQPNLGHNYYRLQQVDMDGKVSVHAQIVDLIWGANGSTVSIYPNPTTDILNIDLYASNAQNTTVKLLDMSGRVIKQIQAKSAVGMNNIKLSMGEIASGVYTIQVYENNSLTHTSKVKKND